jgi:deferrochelatase/peroxidase EfeB
MSGDGTNAADPTADRLQDGIYFRKGERPGRCYRLMLLNVLPATRPSDARDGIAALWRMLQDLRRGIVRDLQPGRDGDPAILVPDGALSCLLGFGWRLFEAESHLPRLVAAESKPIELVRLRAESPATPFRHLTWAADPDRWTGTADLAIQLIAESELAVERAIVETAKLIADDRLPLEMVRFFNGFQRDDGRSWLDFHDGLNNMESSQRRGAIEAVVGDPPWMQGGTYMAVLRTAVDLPVWRRLSRTQQEILVGREKLTGCPLERVARDADNRLTPISVAGCPVTADPSSHPDYRDPPRFGDPLVQASHIHRANLNRGAPDTDANNRIFRQGYEFLESLPDGRLRLGLHFVSFQRRLARLNAILRSEHWLGDVNFGGPAQSGAGDPAPLVLLSLLAGGNFAVPPKADPFPGAEIF